LTIGALISASLIGNALSGKWQSTMSKLSALTVSELMLSVAAGCGLTMCTWKSCVRGNCDGLRKKLLAHLCQQHYILGCVINQAICLFIITRRKGERNMKRRWQIWAIAAVSIFVWATLVYAYFRAARQAIWDEVREHLMSIAQSVALSIDPEEHQQVYRERREDTTLYQKLTEQLQRFANALLPEVR